MQNIGKWRTTRCSLQMQPMVVPTSRLSLFQPRGSGDATVPEWARRNLVTLVLTHLASNSNINTMVFWTVLLSEFRNGNAVRGHPFMTFTRKGRGQVQMVACGWWRRGSAPGVCPHRKLEPTDVFLSSYAKKLAFLYENFDFGRNRNWKSFVSIN